MERTPEDDILDACAAALPAPNEYLLKKYRQDQINGCLRFMEMVFIEATRLFGGSVQYLGSKILGPAEQLEVMNSKSRNAMTVDIVPSELSLANFEFAYLYEENGISRRETFKIPLYLPYLRDNAIIINGSKYYIQFALTDRVFYHIEKDDGIGIKVLRAHLRFCRSIRHQYASLSGQRYSDQIIQVQAHMHKYKYTVEDIRPALLLYPLSLCGLNATLARYGIDPEDVDIVKFWNREDTANEYFAIRNSDGNTPGLYLKVNSNLIETGVDTQSRVSSRVIASLHYVLQYFARCKKTMYTDNETLIPLIKSETNFDIWRIILGRAIYGLNYGNEALVCNYTENHLDSLRTYIDPHTAQKLNDEGVECRDILDLMDYVFLNIDSYVVAHKPSNLFHKRINVLDLLFGSVVRRLFTKIYKHTNNNRKGRKITVRHIEALFRIPPRAFTQMNRGGAVVAINPARYHDNYLITVGGRKMRATHSANTGGNKKSKSGGSHMSSPEHCYHPSWLYVESYGEVSHTNPDIAGTINMFLPITQKGTIIVEDYGKFIDQVLSEYL